MDFIDQLRTLASRIANTKDIVQTEDAIKDAMATPFMQARYHISDPLEVMHEMIADAG